MDGSSPSADPGPRTTAWSASVRAAIAHMNNMELEPALALLDPLCGDDVVATSSDDTVALATAFYLKGLILDRQQQHQGAFDAHRHCIERYALSGEPGAHECVVRCLDGQVMLTALEQDSALIARLPPAHHAFRLPTNIEQFLAIDIEMAEATPEQREATRDSLRRIILNDDARASEQHRAAAAVLDGHFSGDRPFGLYLRNFDIEASEKRLADGTLLTFSTSAQGHIEARAERDLGASLPMIGLANGVNFRKDFAHGIPKLEVANGMWQTVLRILAERARTVLFDYRHASPGVAVELELLQSLGRTGDTVVIVGDETARANMRAQWPAFTRVQLPDEPLPG
jgi:hypothetical protein